MAGGKITRRRFVTGTTGGLSLLVAGCFSGDDPGEYTVELINRENDEVVADYHGHWHGELPSIPQGEHISLGAEIKDEDSSEVPLDNTGVQLAVRVADDEEEIITTESHGDHVHLHGEVTGETAVIVQLVDDSSIKWETSDPIGIEVFEG